MIGWIFLFCLVTVVVADIFEVRKVSFSSTVNESFTIPGITSNVPDPACSFNASLSLEPTVVKTDCVKNIESGNNTLALSGLLISGRITTEQVDALGPAGPELVLDIDCSEQNCMQSGSLSQQR